MSGKSQLKGDISEPSSDMSCYLPLRAGKKKQISG